MGASTSLKTALLWLLTAIITLGSVVYQRSTGPTYPIRGNVNIGDQKVIYRLLRSHETTGNAEMEIFVPDESITGQMRWRRYKSYDDWKTEPLARRGENLIISIPKQPAAGKVMYEITLTDAAGRNYKLSDEPVIIRFKGAVPLFILYPHVLFMFAGMLLATRTGLEGIVKGDNLYRLGLLTLALLFLGGLILGPIVQKFAFGAFWTGWPLGSDLTDNKTMVAVIFWIAAFLKAKYRGRGMHAWAVIAAVVTLLIYLIPHSTLGSEIDYTKMENVQ
jgi:hypothetical protein